MHEGYWGFLEPPFSQTPDPRFFHMGEAHHDAIMMLHYGISRNKGAVLVSGSVGLGKTMLCHKLMSLMLPATTQVVSIVNARLDSVQFPREVLAEMGVESKAKDTQSLLRALRKRLMENYDRGKKTILFIDDAHLIEEQKTFEELRMLLNLQTEDNFLISIVLSGLPTLGERLAECEEFGQMFAVRERLHPLSLVETRDMVRHRLKTAGYIGPGPFNPEAMIELHLHTKGVPRLICQLADYALVLGKSKRAKEIDVPLIHEASDELFGQAMEDAA